MGLEALRAIRIHVFRCDANQLNEHFERLTKSAPITHDTVKDLGTPISTWEAGLKMFYNIDCEYHLGKGQALQNVY